ncbi:MAG: hypothetical protein DID89_2727548491 [Candidatus Nitrotoga sp. CP45]|nr:MAG: hypothetical protein DID89_2727548491 [Candidatus Nitrotoga sp. CP45]
MLEGNLCINNVDHLFVGTKMVEAGKFFDEFK